MIGRLMRCWVAPAVLVFLVRSAAADPITLTGNVPADFGYTVTNGVPSSSTNSSVDIIQHSTYPVHIAQPAWMTGAGLVSGWNINNIAVAYNTQNDTLYVGVNTFGIAGNVDGNGTPGSPNPQLTAAGGSDPANFGGDKSMAVGIAPLSGGTFNASNPPTPTIVAGVPGDKSQVGPGLDGFNVANYSLKGGSFGLNHDLVTSFGSTIAAANVGATGGSNLAYDPSSAHPGFEFSIANFSKILGYDPLKGFVLSTQDGSINSIVTGKDYVPSTLVTFPQPQNLPEPTTWLAWLVMAGGAGWHYRRRRAAGRPCRQS